jgi:nucleotide-binding universal stress UspA family protein
VYEKILVSLDGSKQSECVLDHVRVLAKGCSIPKVVLLRVIEPFPPAAVNYVGDDMVKDVQKKSVAAAEEYLSYLGDGLRTFCGGLETVVVEGNAGHEILEYAKKHGVDLIAMTTHGQSGLLRATIGSVTRHVIDNWTGPTLVVSPAGCRS